MGQRIRVMLTKLDDYLLLCLQMSIKATKKSYFLHQISSFLFIWRLSPFFSFQNFHSDHFSILADFLNLIYGTRLELSPENSENTAVKSFIFLYYFLYHQYLK